jgi:cytochrome P450
VQVEGRLDEARDVVRSLLTEQGQDNPYPWYARLRELAPVYYSDAFGSYLVTRYDDCNDVLVSADIGKADANWADEHAPGWRERPTTRYLFASMLRQNPPDHTRVRGLVNRALGKRRVATLRARIEQITDRTLDHLADAGADGSPVDFQAVVAYPMSAAVVGGLVGVPEADIPLFQRLVGLVSRILDPGIDSAELRQADEATVAIQRHVADMIDERRSRPRDDLISDLLAVRDADGDRLSADEMQATLSLLFMAGLDTSALTFGTGMAAFLVHPGQAAALRADPALAATAADEVIRWDSAAQVAHRRVQRDTVIGGTLLPAGSTVSAMLGAANWDPARFADPDVFDIVRSRPRSMGFGAGIHFCIGAALARLENAVFFPRALRRFPDLALAGTPVRRNTVAIRGFHRLPVSVRAPVPGRPAPRATPADGRARKDPRADR